jgi:hypothetical protein
MPKPGYVSFISQSGALCTAVLDFAAARDFGFSKFISIGNKADVDEVDLLNYFHQDPSTEVIMIYVEELQRGQEFVRLAPRGRDAGPSGERLSFGDLLTALARRGPGSVVALGWSIERDDGHWALTINPDPGERPRADQIRAVYAVADSALLRGNATGSGARTGT